MVSAQFTLEMRAQPEIAKNSLKTPIFGVQGRLRSLVPPERSSVVLVIISKSVSIFNRSHARELIVVKLRFLRGTLL